MPGTYLDDEAQNQHLDRTNPTISFPPVLLQRQSNGCFYSVLVIEIESLQLGSRVCPGSLGSGFSREDVALFVAT